jgi:hypothetical protein
MSKKTKVIIENTIMYIGFLAMVGSIMFNLFAH